MLATTLGADHQGRPADDRRRSCCRCSCSARSASTRSTCSTSAAAVDRTGQEYLEPGLFLRRPLDTRLARPRAGARHRRTAAHPDALLHRARRQGGALVGGVGGGPDRRLLRDDHVPRLRRAGDPRARAARRRPARAATWPRRLAAGARRRRRHVGGDLFLAIIAAVAFATILAVVAGPRDLGLGRGRARRLVEHRPQGPATPRRRRSGSRRSPRSRIGAIAIAIAVIGGEGLNVSFMVGLAFAVAASANFPALLLALTWRRFNTTGAVTGVLFGVISSIALVIISPTVWPGADSEGGALVVRPRQPGHHQRSRSGSSAAGSARCWRARQRPSAASTSC